MVLTPHSALLHTSISLKICSLKALSALGASIRAFQAVRIASLAHVFLREIVAGTFIDASVVQEQSELRLTVTCQTLTRSIACKTGIVTVGSDSEAALRIQHLVSFIGEYLNLKAVCWRRLFTRDQTIYSDLKLGIILYHHICHILDSNDLRDCVESARSEGVVVGELTAGVDTVLCYLGWVVYLDLGINWNRYAFPESNNECCHDVRPPVLVEDTDVLELHPISHLCKEIHQVLIVVIYEHTERVIYLHLETAGRLS